ncbi:geranylgeranylglyceryl/heptaprenylglyceryl phosphate synthase [Rhodoflexus sp.]
MAEVSVQQKINDRQQLLAVLIDPDKVMFDHQAEWWRMLGRHLPDLLLVGGSLLTKGDVHHTVTWLKDRFNIPVWLFPGSYQHLSPAADALLLLSLVSGRNPDFLIGQHVAAAPLIRRMNLQTIPTAYILIDGGRPTTVSYISNTQPIPANKPDLAAVTAMAAEMLGMQMIYLEAGSGAIRPVPAEVIAAVRRAVSLPLIVGGGIRSVDALATAYCAGADVVVIGTAWEQNPAILADMVAMRDETNRNVR